MVVMVAMVSMKSFMAHQLFTGRWVRRSSMNGLLINEMKQSNNLVGHQI